MTTLRHKFGATVGAVVLLTALLSNGVAAGQTGYPPSPTTTSFCTGADADAGVVAVGQTITFTLCGPFQPGATVAITVDGQSVGTKIANGNGAVIIVITITSTTSALVNDPVKTAVNCGANSAVATGPGAVTTTAVRTGTFSINCAPVAAPGPLAFTGANIVKFLLAALALIAIGAALVLAQRRRRSRAA